MSPAGKRYKQSTVHLLIDLLLQPKLRTGTAQIVGIFRRSVPTARVDSRLQQKLSCRPRWKWRSYGRTFVKMCDLSDKASFER
jgi:hypothetical protein